MFKKMRKLSAVLLALTMMLVLAVSAYADSSVLKVPAKNDIDCTVVGDISADGFTVKADVKTDVSQSINYFITGDGLDPEFWNDPDTYVEVDLTLKTDSSTVYVIMPAFTSSWGWVNPSVWDTYLKEGKTVTLREPLTTFYAGFKDETPNLIRIQICSAADETESVEIEVGAIRIVGADSKPVVDDTPVEDDTSAEDNASADDGASDEGSTSAEESVPDEESSSVEESSSAPAEESKPDEESAADEESSSASSDTSDAVSSTTSTSAPASSNTSSGSGPSDDGGATIVIVIIIVAVVAIGGAVAGVIIYRKKKYY